jgi:hypothetical protein
MAILGSTSLTGCNSIPDFIAAGTLMLFQQTTAPTSWTKDTTSHNNKALRVVTGTASSGGTTAFTTVFASRTPSGTVSGHTLSLSQIPSHDHKPSSNGGNAFISGPNDNGVYERQIGDGIQGVVGGGSFSNGWFRSFTTSSTGGGGSHSHGFVGTAMDFAVQYVDVIIASKS